MKMPFLARAVVYLLAFLVPPVLVSVVGFKAVESTRYEESPDAAKIQAGELPAPPGHDPDKPTAVVLLSNQGAEVTDVLAPYEIELASVLDVYPGPLLTANTTTLTPEGPRSPLRTEHGVYFVPRSDLDSAPGLDRVFVPGGTAPSVTDPRVRSWAREKGLELEFIHAHAPVGFPLDATLSDLAEHENASVARFTGRLLEYPIGHLALAGGGWPFAHLLRPLAVGLLLGVALVVLTGRLLGPATKRFGNSPEGTSTGASAKPVAKAKGWSH